MSEQQMKPGDTFLAEGDDYWTAGIDIGEHGNAIECYRSTEAEANALRDEILAALQNTRALSPVMNDGVVERVEAAIARVRAHGLYKNSDIARAAIAALSTAECEWEHWRSADQWRRGECFIRELPCKSCRTRKHRTPHNDRA